MVRVRGRGGHRSDFGRKADGECEKTHIREEIKPKLHGRRHGSGLEVIEGLALELEGTRAQWPG